MNSILLFSLLVLGVTGLVAAVLLYIVAQRFHVEEDPRIDQVQEVLPGANCGGCGFAGCRALAEACVKADSLEGLLCPVGGAATMAKVGDILGLAPAASEPKVAVVRCNGTCAARPRLNEFNGVRTCANMAGYYAGETGCSFGCLGCGDCVAACQFGALRMDEETGLPVVDEQKCTSCGKCVQACPKGIIELRRKGDGGQRMTVLCMNKDRGPQARKACQNACIGCGKCQSACGFEAIRIENNLAYIDAEKCQMCRDCESQCPTGAIWAQGVQDRKFAAGKPAVQEPTEKTAGDKKGFDPQCAAVIKSLPTPRAAFPNNIRLAQHLG